MGTARLQANALVRLNGTEHRIMRKVDDSTWQIENVKTGRIAEFATHALMLKIETRDLEFISNSPVLSDRAINLFIPDEQLEIAKLRRLYVIATLNVPNTRTAMETVINDKWKQLGKPDKRPGWTSVWGWKKRYLAQGEDFRALINNQHKKGNRVERYPAEVRELAEQAIAASYLKRERTTIKTTLEDATARVRVENSRRPAGMLLPTPSRRFITRLIDEVPAFRRYVARRGRQEARLRFRSVGQTPELERPLERAEIDHTLLDLFVVDERTFTPLGRPWLTVCIDSFTRCVLGIYVGFNPPSYLTVAQCLKNAILPKASLRERYPNIKSEWIAYGVMDELVTDQGTDFHSRSLEALCLSLPTNLTYSPRKEPWFKGKVERFFGTLNRGFAHTLPGTSFANTAERGDYDAMRSACVTLSDLQMYLRMWIVDVYHQEVHRALGTTPHSMWKAHMRTEDIRLPNDTINFDAFVGTVHRRKLTHKGIQFSDLFYNSRELTDMRMKYGPTLDVEIRVDESDLGKIYVFAPEVSKPITVPALCLKYAAGLSLWAHDVIKKRTAELNEGNIDQEKLDATKRALREWVQRALATKKRGLAKRPKRFLDGTQNSSLVPAGSLVHEDIESNSDSIPSRASEPARRSGVIFDQPLLTDEDDADDAIAFEAIPKKRLDYE